MFINEQMTEKPFLKQSMDTIFIISPPSNIFSHIETDLSIPCKVHDSGKGFMQSTLIFQILFLKMFIMTHKIDFMTYQMGPTHNMKNTDTETFSSVVLVA